MAAETFQHALSLLPPQYLLCHATVSFIDAVTTVRSSFVRVHITYLVETAGEPREPCVKLEELSDRQKEQVLQTTKAQGRNSLTALHRTSVFPSRRASLGRDRGTCLNHVLKHRKQVCHPRSSVSRTSWSTAPAVAECSPPFQCWSCGPPFPL